MEETIKVLQEHLETLDSHVRKCEQDITALQGARVAYGKMKEMVVAKIRGIEEDEKTKLERKEKAARVSKRRDLGKDKRTKDKEPANASD